MTSAALLGQLRLHCNGGWRGCPACDPATGRYCPVAAPIAEAFATARREANRPARPALAVVLPAARPEDRDAASVRARLRRHVRCCYRCDMRAGRYCAAAWPDAVTLFELRRSEVLAERARWRRAA